MLLNKYLDSHRGGNDNDADGGGGGQTKWKMSRCQIWTKRKKNYKQVAREIVRRSAALNNENLEADCGNIRNTTLTAISHHPSRRVVWQRPGSVEMMRDSVLVVWKMEFLLETKQLVRFWSGSRRRKKKYLQLRWMRARRWDEVQLNANHSRGFLSSRYHHCC